MITAAPQYFPEGHKCQDQSALAASEALRELTERSQCFQPKRPSFDCSAKVFESRANQAPVLAVDANPFSGMAAPSVTFRPKTIPSDIDY